MTDTDKTHAAFDPDSTPNVLVGDVDQDIEVVTKPPIAPTPVGETLVDAESGEVRHVAANDDGTPVQLARSSDDEES
jgi:hypothetical protein